MEYTGNITDLNGINLASFRFSASSIGDANTLYRELSSTAIALMPEVIDGIIIEKLKINL